MILNFIEVETAIKIKLCAILEKLKQRRKLSPVFGFNSAKYDIYLMKSYLLPILVNERDIEPTVIKKANQFVFFSGLETFNYLTL